MTYYLHNLMLAVVYTRDSQSPESHFSFCSPSFLQFILNWPLVIFFTISCPAKIDAPRSQVLPIWESFIYIIGRVTSLPVPMVDGFILLLANSGCANGEIAAQNMKLISWVQIPVNFVSPFCAYTLRRGIDPSFLLPDMVK